MKLYRVIGEYPSPYIEGPAAIRAAIIRWILNILHDPKHPLFRELWKFSIIRSCRVLSINSNLRPCSELEGLGAVESPLLLRVYKPQGLRGLRI